MTLSIWWAFIGSNEYLSSLLCLPQWLPPPRILMSCSGYRNLGQPKLHNYQSDRIVWCSHVKQHPLESLTLLQVAAQLPFHGHTSDQKPVQPSFFSVSFLSPLVIPVTGAHTFCPLSLLLLKNVHVSATGHSEHWPHICFLQTYLSKLRRLSKGN